MSRREQYARELTSADMEPENLIESGSKSGGGFGTFADLRGFQDLIAKRQEAVSEQIKPVDPAENYTPEIDQARAEAIDRINTASIEAEKQLSEVIGDSEPSAEIIDTLMQEQNFPVSTIETAPKSSTDRRTLRTVFQGGEDFVITTPEKAKSVVLENKEQAPKTADRKTLRESFRVVESIGTDLPKTLDMEPEVLPKTLDMPAVTLTDVLEVESPVKPKATIIDLGKGVVMQEEPSVQESKKIETLPAEPAPGWEKPYVSNVIPIEAEKSTLNVDEVNTIEDRLNEPETLIGAPADMETARSEKEPEALFESPTVKTESLFIEGAAMVAGALALSKLLQKNGISEEDWNRFDSDDRAQVEKIQKEIDLQQERIDQLRREKQEIKMKARAEVGYKAPLSKEAQIQMQEKDREIAAVEALMLKNRNQQEKILRKPTSSEIAETLVDAEDEVKPGKIEEYLQQAPEPKSSWWKNHPRLRKAATGVGMLAGAGLIAGAWLGINVIKKIFRPFKITEMLGNGVYHIFNFLERSIIKGDPIGALSDAANGAGKFFDEKMKNAEDWVNKKPEKKS